MFGNVRLAFGTILENLRKSSESGRKSSENHQKRCHQHVLYNKKNITRQLEDMNFMFSWQEQYPTRSLRSLVRYCSYHSNIKFISSRHRVISSMQPLSIFFKLPFGNSYPGLAETLGIVVSSLHSKWRIHDRVWLFYNSKIQIAHSLFFINVALLRTLFIRIKNVNFLTTQEIYITYMTKFAKNARKDLRIAYNCLLVSNNFIFIVFN